MKSSNKRNNQSIVDLFRGYIRMFTACFAVTCLFMSFSASAQPAEFSGNTGILEIPLIIINGQQTITEAELQLQETDSIMFRLLDYAANQGVGVQELQMSYGENVALADGRMLRFIDVMAESRCPSDVVCITSGEVTVILRITDTFDNGNTSRSDFGLTLGGQDISSHYDNGLYYRLTEATPFPVSTVEVADADCNGLQEYSPLPFKQ